MTPGTRKPQNPAGSSIISPLWGPGIRVKGGGVLPATDWIPGRRGRGGLPEGKRNTQPMIPYGVGGLLIIIVNDLKNVIFGARWC